MVVCNMTKCDFCGSCVAVCPHNAIDLYEAYFEVSPDKCTNCGICVSICPARALKLEVGTA